MPPKELLPVPKKIFIKQKARHVPDLSIHLVIVQLQA
jgi:hypothetical protein